MTKQVEESGKVHHPVVAAMLQQLPSVGAAWPVADRARWLSAMEAVLHMVYGPAERIDISALIVEAPTAEEVAASIAVPSSAEPTDKAMARDEDAGSGSGDASTTEAADEAGMGSEWSSSAEANQVETDAASDEKTPSEPDPPKLPPLKNVGGAPSKTGRPENMPPNLSCAIEAIGELGGRASAPQIRNYVRDKYWPKLPDHWTAVLWGFVSEEKLARDGINFIVPGTRPVPARAIVTAAPKAVLPEKPTLPPKQPSPAPPLRAFTFKHGDKSVMLASAQQLSIVHRLQQALGQHVAEAFLAERVFGTNTERHRELVKAQALGLNGLLFDVGLKVMHYPGFGLIMKEVE